MWKQSSNLEFKVVGVVHHPPIEQGFDTKMFVVSLKKMVMCHVDIDTQAAILLPSKF